MCNFFVPERSWHPQMPTGAFENAPSSGNRGKVPERSWHPQMPMGAGNRGKVAHCVECMIEMSFEPQIVPLHTDESGTIRVGNTRVRLDTVVYAFNQGYTAEQIVDHYPALQLMNVYRVPNRPAARSCLCSLEWYVIYIPLALDTNTSINREKLLA